MNLSTRLDPESQKNGSKIFLLGLNRKAPEVTDLGSLSAKQQASLHGSALESSGLSTAFRQVAGLANWLTVAQVMAI